MEGSEQGNRQEALRIDYQSTLRTEEVALTDTRKNTLLLPILRTYLLFPIIDSPVSLTIPIFILPLNPPKVIDQLLPLNNNDPAQHLPPLIWPTMWHLTADQTPSLIACLRTV